ncbi:OmpA family protein [Pedobacter sp. GR22-10]|uniref:OmpA family protein n=1 Tax=Pedobacter sp. GR22-10 TaxID=2994472 RepID=UPI002244FFAB|nr:OmpA family protein [Pedobacter sp. GR22-10]MCX2433391.1 OmpA family protein [Pedobacter sp. GR22-10]
MAKGVKKIIWTGEGRVLKKGSIANHLLVLAAGDFVWFKVGEWLEGTTEQEKTKDVKWAIFNDKGYIDHQRTIPGNFKYGYKIPKPLCGPYTYYIEASLTGNFDGKSGLKIRGESPARINDSRWSRNEGGADVRKTYQFSYGELIWLRLFTEGLNGYKNVEVRVFRKLRSAFGLLPKDDEVTRKIYFVEVIRGEINLKIPNTYLWRQSMKDVSSVEEFYIRVVHPVTGQYIQDNFGSGDTTHARFLRIKDKTVSQVVEIPQNRTPVTIYEPDKNAARFELCKFEQITVTEEGSKPELVFDNGAGVKNIINRKEDVIEPIIFNFNSTGLSSESLKKLNNILQFLLEHKHSIIHLDGFACVIGKQNYNNILSENRAKTVREFFVKGKLDPVRMVTSGHGEVNPTDDKMGRDNIKYKDEESYKGNRRVDISFQYYGHNAETIIYQSIGGPTPRNIKIEPVKFETKACFERPQHTKNITLSNVNLKASSVGNITIPAISTMSKDHPMPLNYIWPMNNLTEFGSFSSANDYSVHVHSCRYFSVRNNPTIKVKVYPDIKWNLDFMLNLNNDLSVKWQNLSPEQHKEFQSKAGKIGAERRWKQKDATFNFGLKAQWDKSGTVYGEDAELKAEYEGKFKKLYNIFSSIGSIADGITSVTKGAVKKAIPGVPASFVVKPPNLSLTGEWFLKKVLNSSNLPEVGTDVKITLNANPLIGLEVTIDLLAAIIFGASGVVSGGAAAPGVLKLYNQIQDKLKKGIDVGDDSLGFKSSINIYMDLIITSEITVDSEFKFNTVGKPSDSRLKVCTEAKLKIELKVGVIVKGEVSMAVIKAYAYFEASASGDASVTFGHKIIYDEKGLYYRPLLGFDGLNAKYIVSISMGLAKKIIIDKTKIKQDENNKVVIAEGNYPEVIPKFDVIEHLEKLFETSANIPLIKN